MNPLLKNTDLFRSLPDEILEKVTLALIRRSLEDKQVLFRQGEPGNELIIVEEGQIAIYAPAADDPAKGQSIRIFQPGQVLGEMALIDQKPRSLSARAEEPSTVLALGGRAFRDLIKENPEMAIAVMSGLSERIRYTTDFLSEVRTWVQRVSSGDYQTQGVNAQDSRYQDQTLATLAAEFAQMAARVQEREDKLKQEVALLRIEIDESKRKQEVKDITSTDMFLSIKEKAKLLRQQKSE
ncbi:MAG: cyclic nucleotide-binding domain-containing protein [Anaerolineales bacterium]|nr:cyclic nucleotide-binding domain-containing protein [Anaerolineales bacterium]